MAFRFVLVSLLDNPDVILSHSFGRVGDSLQTSSSNGFYGCWPVVVVLCFRRFSHAHDYFPFLDKTTNFIFSLNTGEKLSFWSRDAA
jgi:hypothetical protein